MTRGRSVGGPDAHPADAAVGLASDLDPHAEELPQDVDVGRGMPREGPGAKGPSSSSPGAFRQPGGDPQRDEELIGEETADRRSEGEMVADLADNLVSDSLGARPGAAKGREPLREPGGFDFHLDDIPRPVRVDDIGLAAGTILGESFEDVAHLTLADHRPAGDHRERQRRTEDLTAPFTLRTVDMNRRPGFDSLILSHRPCLRP